MCYLSIFGRRGVRHASSEKKNPENRQNISKSMTSKEDKDVKEKQEFVEWILALPILEILMLQGENSGENEVCAQKKTVARILPWIALG